MEGVHGVDVSWLHHSGKDHAANKAHKAGLMAPVDKKPNGLNGSQPKTSLLHSHLHSPPPQDKTDKPDPTTPSPKSSKESKPNGPGRRSSWVSSISSRFSAASNGPPTTKTDSTLTVDREKGSVHDYTRAMRSPSPSAMAKEEKKGQDAHGAPPPSPKSHSFLHSAMRRLSSGGSSMGKAAGIGGACPRKVMNIDPYRERCLIEDLQQEKLRRVAFCVDVEIAGAAQYPNAEPEPTTKPNSTTGHESSLTQLEHKLDDDQKRRKQQKLGKGEGAALKQPALAVEEKESGDSAEPSQGLKDSETAKATPQTSDSVDENKDNSKKKEKKKRSESERKERKERKQRDALANGKIPAEIRPEDSGSSDSGSPPVPSAKTAPDRPTTDPLRIYRRCCQLRETSILKRIADQIALPSACPVATPNLLNVLDLSNFHMQLPDIITLGDYLAVVPVKKLVMENCGLSDEAVRVILAGLLAAKTPEQIKFNKKLCRKRPPKTKDLLERSGVVEKISFKNNPKIGPEGWQHIAFFVNMSRSLKAVDLSMIPFPSHALARSNSGRSQNDQSSPQKDILHVFHEALASRIAGDQLEEVVLAECSIDTDSVGRIVDAIISCGATRLGLASNNLDKDGLEHVLRYVKSGKCEGLDVGGNDMSQHTQALAGALDDECPLFALSLADCNLTTASMEILLPALTRLKNFRFIDLSHNRGLFSTSPSALRLLRKYLPIMPLLKRIHLIDVAMTSEHAIALAEVLPECKYLAHLNILDNHLITPLAEAKTEEMQEEACALYASYMVAVRVSVSIICVDIEVPKPESSEIVKALAKQIVAYSLRNLERLPLTEMPDSAIAAMTEPHGGQKPSPEVPEVLMHIVGHMEGIPDTVDSEEPAPDDDYIVGGTGVVKALDICLKRSVDARKGSYTQSPMLSGTTTPSTDEATRTRAKEMSKDLLGSARKIRARLRPALINEARLGSTSMNMKRLQFLNSTLERMIERFEDEYPETRLPAAGDGGARTTNASGISMHTTTGDPEPLSLTDPEVLDAEEEPENPLVIHPASLSRRASSPNLALRQAKEEGQVHRFGQRLRREVLPPDMEDHAHGTTGDNEARHLRDLRQRLEQLDAADIRDKLNQYGSDAALAAIGATAEELKCLNDRCPHDELLEEASGSGGLSAYLEELEQKMQQATGYTNANEAAVPSGTATEVN